MTNINPDLLKQAEEMNIEVTENATEEALQAAIDEILAEDASAAGKTAKAATKKAAKAEKLIPMRIKRDLWDKDEVRHAKGTVVEVSAEIALEGVEKGTLERVKD